MVKTRAVIQLIEARFALLGAPARALGEAARQLPHELGHRG